MADNGQPTARCLNERLVLSNRVMDLSRAARWLSGLSREAGLSTDDAYRIDLVIAEALGNVVFYAYSGREEQPVELGWASDPELVTLEMRDGGVPFDPLQHRQRPLVGQLEDAEPGGMGILLMRSFSDAIAYRHQDGENILTLSFAVEPQFGSLLASVRGSDGARPGSLELVSQCPLFDGLERSALEQLVEQCPTKRLAAGEVLLSIGQVNHHLYLVRQGRLDVHLEAVDSTTTLMVPPGECVGELSIIDGKPASAYVVAAEDTEVLVISDEVFWTRLGETPELARNMLRVLTERIRRHNEETMRAMEARLRFGQIGRELALAADLQTSMLPCEFEQLREEFPQADIAASMEPARDIGGDFYDVFALDDHRICIAIGDVSGKGMPAALFMVRSMTLLRTQVRKKRRLTKSLSRINALLCENNPTHMFVTLVVAVVDLEQREVHWVNAGHDAPLLLRRGGRLAPLTDAKGILLGVDEGASFTEGSNTFRPGDALLLYTDGVTEARSMLDTMFGRERLFGFLDTQHSDAGAGQLVGGLRERVRAFVGDAPQSDDITLLAFRFER